MMHFARGVILCRPTTRRGLIHQVRYLASQFNDLVGEQIDALEAWIDGGSAPAKIGIYPREPTGSHDDGEHDD